jgi:hypothetical protein
MSRWHIEADVPELENDDLTPSELARGLSEAEGCVERSWTISDVSQCDLTDSELGPDELDEGTNLLPDVDAYTQLIRSTVGYANLLANLRRTYVLMPSEPNAIHRIQTAVLDFLPVSPVISRRNGTQGFRLTYHLAWDFFSFHKEQEYDVSPAEALESAICLTGSRCNIQALPCREYIMQTWPSIGDTVLGLIKKLVVSSNYSDVCSSKF